MESSERKDINKKSLVLDVNTKRNDQLIKEDINIINPSSNQKIQKPKGKTVKKIVKKKKKVQNPADKDKKPNDLIIHENPIIDEKQLREIFPESVIHKKKRKGIVFRIHRKIMVCPFCKKNITTNVEKKLNKKSLTFYIIVFIFLPFLMFVCPASFAWWYNYRTSYDEFELEEEEIKDDYFFNFVYDGIHYCENCSKQVGFYDSFPFCRKDEPQLVDNEKKN